tara:strand:+ start:4631 stop:5491 length:861 start_codon:yes stop_codon:yes gene_type:complete
MTEEAAPTEEAPAQEVMAEAAEEAAAEEQAPVEEPKPEFSRQFAAIAKKERALRQRESSVKQMESRIAELEGSQGQFGEIQRLAKENPAALLAKLGINYDELTQQVINDGNQTEEQGLRRQNEQLQARLEKIEGVYEGQKKDAEEKRLDTARATLVDNIKNFVDNDEQYSLVKLRGAYDLVAEVMQEHYASSNGEILEYSAAANVVEAHYEKEAEKYFGAQKIQDRWKAQMVPAEPEAPQEEAVPANNGGPKTLSNKNSAQTTERDGGMLSRAESLQRMAQMLNGA